MPTYRVDVEYEGTRYRGWQVQANARSIAGELHRAVAEAGGRLLELGGSGRTDAGVHALRQTAHLRLRGEVDPEPFRRAMNEALPPDIHVLGLWRAGDRFHARHDAVSRSYVYQLSRRRTALAKRFVWWIREPLDAARMERAAAALLGRHDFRHLCERPAEQTSTEVAVDRAQVVVAGDMVLVRLAASHFLWKMVRRVVGVLVRVGTGTTGDDALASLLDPDRGASGAAAAAAGTAPPSGLFLERVVYPGEPAPGALVPASAVSESEDGGGRPYLGRGVGPSRGPSPAAPRRKRRGGKPGRS